LGEKPEHSMGEVGAIAQRTMAQVGGHRDSISEVHQICAPVALVCHLLATYICSKVRRVIKGVGGRIGCATQQDDSEGTVEAVEARPCWWLAQLHRRLW